MNRFVIQLDGVDVGSHELEAHAQMWAEAIGGSVFDRENVLNDEEWF